MLFAMSCCMTHSKKEIEPSSFDPCVEFKRFRFTGDEALTNSESTVKQAAYYNERLKKKCPNLFK